MNFLQLCQRTRQDCGISGSGPATVVGQSGEIQRIVDWVRQAWVDIQLWHQWDWMVNDFTFNTTAGKREYTPAEAGLTDHRLWLIDTLRSYKLSAGKATEQYLPFSEFDWFRDVYLFAGADTQQGPLNTFTVRPRNKNLVFAYIPDDVYTVSGRYRRSSQSLAANTDTPTGLPEEYHQIIVERARVHYAGYEAAPDVMQDATSKFKTLLARLESDWLPEITTGGPLA